MRLKGQKKTNPKTKGFYSLGQTKPPESVCLFWTPASCVHFLFAVLVLDLHV